MIGRADIEESKSYVVTNTKLPQASYPYDNFSNTAMNMFSNRGSFSYAFTQETKYLTYTYYTRLHFLPKYSKSSKDKVSVEYHPS